MVSRGDSKTRRIYETLRDRILLRELMTGTKLPSHLDLAAEFGVAPMTLRTVLAQLESEGLVSREQGRGTFVRQSGMPLVLLVDCDVTRRVLLHAQVAKAGYRAVEAEGSREALAILEGERTIDLVVGDVHMPDRDDGVAFIRTVRRRWPALPLAAVTSYPDDLSDLFGTPEYPMLILTRPIGGYQIEGMLRLVLERPAALNRRDWLTGLPTREVFDDRLKTTLAYAKRHDQQVGLLLLDLDGFAGINERFGHDTGDLLLREISRRLAERTRNSDTVAHLGGDEFAVILPSVESRDNAAVVVRKITEDFERGFEVGDQVLSLSACIGMGLYPFDGADAITLLRAVEHSLDRAKRQRTSQPTAESSST